MKNLLVSLLALPVIASSQVSLDQVTKVPLEGYCLNKEQFRETLRQYQEKPILAMDSLRTNKKGEVIGHEAVLFINPKTGTWTLFEDHGEKGYCMVAMGEKIKPVQSQNMRHDNLPERPIDKQKSV